MRGQAHTLEGVIAALLVVSSVVFALQMATVTPLTASTANQHIENQERAAAAGLLAAAAEENALRPSILYWNADERRFHGVGTIGYYDTHPPGTRFGELLNESFEGVAYNVNFYYHLPSGERRVRRFVYSGNPSDDAVAVTRKVTLYDGDFLRDASGGKSARTLDEAPFFAPDASPGGHLYNVVEVEVVVWQM